MHASLENYRQPEGELVQGQFFLAEFRPLLTIDETCYLLADPSPRMVINRLDDGTLRGVDISAEGEKAGRREPRIYRYSVEALYCPAMRGKRLPKVSPETILPHGRSVFRRDEVRLILNCTSKHVGNLPLTGPVLSSGASVATADRTPRIFRESLIEFLTVREIKP